MITLRELTDFLDTLLANDSIPQDKSNNGLQIEGNALVKTIIGGVDGCRELYQRAAEKSADFIIVHHGESWGDGLKYFSGMTGRRFATLFQNNMSLYASHLPLDAHRKIGHNVIIASLIELQNVTSFAKYANVEIGVYGHLQTPLTAIELGKKLDKALETESTVYDFFGGPVQHVGIISGSGASALHECKRLNLQCLVTGECDHTHYHVIKELELSLIASGHYKTEVPGIKAVLDSIQHNFDVSCEFIDIPTEL